MAEHSRCSPNLVPHRASASEAFASQLAASFAMWAWLVLAARFCREFLGEFAQRTSLHGFRVVTGRSPRSAAAVNGLHHLALGTRDVERLARFYRDVLELPEVARHAHADGTLRSVWLNLGGSVLMLEHTSEAPRVVHGVGAGPFLIALAVSPGAREASEQRLERAGCSIESRTDWTSYARDPDGNRIALSVYELRLLDDR